MRLNVSSAAADRQQAELNSPVASVETNTEEEEGRDETGSLKELLFKLKQWRTMWRM